MDRHELKDKFRTSKGHWRLKEIKEHYGSYSNAYMGFIEAMGMVPFDRSNRKIVAELRKRAFLVQNSILFAFMQKIPLKDNEARDSFIMDLMKLKREYLKISNTEYLGFMIKIFDLGLTSRTLKDLIEQYDRLDKENGTPNEPGKIENKTKK